MVTLILTGLVSGVIFVSIGVIYQRALKTEVDETLQRAVELDNSSIELPQIFGDDSEDDDSENSLARNTLVYSLRVTTAGLRTERSNSTARMDSDTTDEALAAVFSYYENNGAHSGTLSSLNLFYRIQELYVNDSVVAYNVAFADTSAYTGTVLVFCLRLLLFWLALMCALFVITLFLSRRVTKPVEQAWESQQRFIADASHELKTPLTVVLANTSILEKNKDATVRDQWQWIDGIAVEASRMQKLTENMLTLAFADTGPEIKKFMSDVDYSQIVESVLLQFEAVAFERGLSINETVMEGLHVRGDAAKLASLIKTLMENACKYSSQPGVIDVMLRRDKNSAYLSVHNDGEPIPQSKLPHVFERFYRSDKARTHDGESASFGLGLAIAKSTVELHAGSIEVSSGTEGTTFMVRLPLLK